MPHVEMERLDRNSGSGQVSAAVSACIAAEIRAGREPDEAKGMCYSLARDKTGKELAPKAGS